MPMPMTLGSFDHSAAQRLNNLYRREQLSRDFVFSRGSTGSSQASVQSSPEMFVENGIEYPLGMLDSANPAISGDLVNGSKILANQPQTSKLLPAFRNRPDELLSQPITTSSIPDCTFAARDSRYYPSGAGSVVLQRVSPSHPQQLSPIQSVSGQDHQANHCVQLTSSLRSTLGIRSVGEVPHGNGFDPQRSSGSNNGIAYDHYIDHVLTPSLADVLKQGEAPIAEYSCFITPPPEHALPPPSLNNSVDVVPTFPSLRERNEDMIIAQPRVVVPTKSRWPAPASSNEASVVDPGTSIATTMTLAFDNSQPRSSSFSNGGAVTTTVGLLDTKVNSNSRFPALIGDPAVIRPDELELSDPSQIVMAKNGSNGKQLIGVKPMSALHVNGNHANSHQHQFAQPSCLLQDDKRAASNAPLFRRYKSSSVSDSGIEASNNFRNGTDAIRQGVPEFYSSPNPADARHHSFSHQFHQSKLSDRNDHIANLYRELNSSDHHSVPLLQHADVNNSKIEGKQTAACYLVIFYVLCVLNAYLFLCVVNY
jgi:hypothetical protein